MRARIRTTKTPLPDLSGNFVAGTQVLTKWATAIVLLKHGWPIGLLQSFRKYYAEIRGGSAFHELEGGVRPAPPRPQCSPIANRARTSVPSGRCGPSAITWNPAPACSALILRLGVENIDKDGSVETT